MQKHRLYILFTIIAVLSFFLSVGRNMGQDMQPSIIQNADDITAWQEEVFVLDNKALIKLNAELEVVKTVPLPLEPAPLEPRPVPNTIAPPYMEDSSVSANVGAIDTQLTGRVCADSGHIYVLYEGVIFVFDHNLNFIKSKALEYGT